MFNERRAANRKEQNNSERQKVAVPSGPAENRDSQSSNTYNNRDRRPDDYNRDRHYDYDNGTKRNRDHDRDRDQGHNRERLYHDNRPRSSNKYRERDHRQPRQQSNYNRYDGRNSNTSAGNYRHERGSFHNRGRNDRQSHNSVPSLEELRLKDSFWDKEPVDYEGASAARAKASGLFPHPGDHAKKTLDKAEVTRILNKQRTVRGLSVEQSILTPLHSRISRSLILSGVDFSVVAQQTVQKILENFLVSTIIPNVSYEDHSLSTELTENGLIVEANTSIVASALMSFNGKEIPELNTVFKLERPREYIEFDDDGDTDINSNEDIADEIIESPSLCCINNLPLGTSREEVVTILSKYAKLRSLTVLIDKLTYESSGVVFFDFQKLGEDYTKTEEIIKSIEDKENLKCFMPCRNFSREYVQKIKLTANNIMDIVDSNSVEISKHAITSILQFFNCLSLEEILDDEKYKDRYESFKDECSNFKGFEKLDIPKPPSTFKQYIDELKPQYCKIYVKFDTPNNARQCLKGLCGRYFYNRIVIGTYLEDYDYANGII